MKKKREHFEEFLRIAGRVAIRDKWLIGGFLGAVSDEIEERLARERKQKRGVKKGKHEIQSAAANR